MIRQTFFTAMLGLSICGHVASADAQQDDRPNPFYDYARNKMGLLRYCRDHGLVAQVTADKAVKAIEVALRRLPVSGGSANDQGDKAERAGAAGFWKDANGNQELASVAKLFGTTTAGLCNVLAGESRTVPQPAATRQVAPKVPTSALIKPAGSPATSTEAVAPVPAAKSAGAIECEGNFQVQKNGNRIATPYCQDDYLAIVARKYGMKVSGRDIRQDYSEKQQACRLVGEDNRVRDTCSQYRLFKRTQR